MPYIKKENRGKYDTLVNECVNILTEKDEFRKNCEVGELNYLISSIIWNLFSLSKSYGTANDLMGVLECVKLEFYRRNVSLYEDFKKLENGDISTN